MPAFLQPQFLPDLSSESISKTSFKFFLLSCLSMVSFHSNRKVTKTFLCQGGGAGGSGSGGGGSGGSKFK